jgi:hypothetical protein
VTPASAAIALVEVAAAPCARTGDGGVDQAIALIGIIGVGRRASRRRCRGAGDVSDEDKRISQLQTVSRY